MVNVASTRAALCTNYIELGKSDPDAPPPPPQPPYGAIGLAHEEPHADGTFTEASDAGYSRQPANWHAPTADGVIQADTLTFTLAAGVYEYMLFLEDLESDVLVDYCELTGAVLPDDSTPLLVSPRYTQT